MRRGHRGEGLLRVLRLGRRCTGRVYLPPLPELAQEFGVSTRTIRRDLETLEWAGYDVPAWRLNERLGEGAIFCE